jgi:hypothetical protein
LASDDGASSLQLFIPWRFLVNIEAVPPVESNLIVALSIPETEQQTPLLFSHDILVQEHIADIRLAAAKMSGLQRRNFMAEMSIKYCTSNARLTERVFGWARETVETGLGSIPVNECHSFRFL